MRIDVQNLPVALVLKQNALDTFGNDLVVGRIVGGDHLVLPVVEAQVRGSWQQLFLAAEIRLKVLGFEAVRVVNVARYFLAFLVCIAYENDRLKQKSDQERPIRKQKFS